MGTPLRLKRSGGPEREVELVVDFRFDGHSRASTAKRSPRSNREACGWQRDARDRRSALSHQPARNAANSILVAAGAMSAEYQIVEARRGARQAGLTSPTIDAPMPGTVLKILVMDGARVEANDPLIVLEAMKTETTLSAESPAIVKARMRAGRATSRSRRDVDRTGAGS